MQYWIIFEVVLFCFGFIYGLFLGNKEINLVLRAFIGGLFFMFFYITIPITLILILLF